MEAKPYAGRPCRTKKKGFVVLTNKGKYGLKALIDLARLAPGETAFSMEIATRNNISKKFLDTILLELRNAGLVRSKKGPGGGYALSKAPSEIMIGQAIRVLDGPLAPIRCASRTAFEACDDCHDPEICLVRLAMTEVRDAMADILDKMTLAHLVSRGSIDALLDHDNGSKMP
jgi:Rrf2 family protein